jgi:hypothetical protein
VVAPAQSAAPAADLAAPAVTECSAFASLCPEGKRPRLGIRLRAARPRVSLAAVFPTRKNRSYPHPAAVDGLLNSRTGFAFSESYGTGTIAWAPNTTHEQPLPPLRRCGSSGAASVNGVGYYYCCCCCDKVFDVKNPLGSDVVTVAADSGAPGFELGSHNERQGIMNTLACGLPCARQRFWP